MDRRSSSTGLMFTPGYNPAAIRLQSRSTKAAKLVWAAGVAGVETRRLRRIEAIDNETTIAVISETAKHRIVPRGRLTVIDVGNVSADRAREEVALSISVSSIE